jgi:hypothetical protein
MNFQIESAHKDEYRRQRERVRSMTYRAVSIPDQLERTLFEIFTIICQGGCWGQGYATEAARKWSTSGFASWAWAASHPGALPTTPPRPGCWSGWVSDRRDACGGTNTSRALVGYAALRPAGGGMGGVGPVPGCLRPAGGEAAFRLFPTCVGVTAMQGRV